MMNLRTLSDQGLIYYNTFSVTVEIIQMMASYSFSKKLIEHLQLKTSSSYTCYSLFNFLNICLLIKHIFLLETSYYYFVSIAVQLLNLLLVQSRVIIKIYKNGEDDDLDWVSSVKYACIVIIIYLFLGVISFISYSFDMMFDESVDVRNCICVLFFIAQITRTLCNMKAPKPYISNTIILPLTIAIRIAYLKFCPNSVLIQTDKYQPQYIMTSIIIGFLLLSIILVHLQYKIGPKLRPLYIPDVEKKEEEGFAVDNDEFNKYYRSITYGTLRYIQKFKIARLMQKQAIERKQKRLLKENNQENSHKLALDIQYNNNKYDIEQLAYNKQVNIEKCLEISPLKGNIGDDEDIKNKQEEREQQDEQVVPQNFIKFSEKKSTAELQSHRSMPEEPKIITEGVVPKIMLEGVSQNAKVTIDGAPYDDQGEIDFQLKFSEEQAEERKIWQNRITVYADTYLNDIKIEECPICLESFEKLDEGQKIIHVYCKHVFHLQCLKYWLKQRNSCPCCRFKIPIISDEQEKQFDLQ